MSRHVVTVVKCDMCGTEEKPDEMITTRSYVWLGKNWAIDVCPADAKVVDDMMDELTVKSTRVTDTGTLKTSGKKRPYANEPRFNQWKGEDDKFHCPYSWTDDRGPHQCVRSFTTANGLAVHHARQHGSNL